MNVNSALNDWSDIWSTLLLGSLIDTATLLLVISLVWWTLRKRLSAQFGYGLFLLVILKAMIPLQLPGPSFWAALSPQQQWQSWTAQQADLETPRPEVTEEFIPSPIEFAEIEQETPITDVETTTVATTPIAPLATVAAPAPPSPQLTTASCLMIAWAAITAALLTRLFYTHLRFSHRLKVASPVAPESLPIDLEELKQAVGVKQKIRCVTVEGLSSPAVWGIWRPYLLLPPDFSATYNHQQMRWILPHELAHISRRDLAIALLQRITQIAHLFNPAVWFANLTVNRLREYACDDAALLAAQSSRRDCGDAFLRAVESAHEQPAELRLAVGVFRPGAAFRSRLIRILDSNRRLQGKLPVRSVIALLLIAAVVLPGVRADEEQAPQEQTPQEQPAQKPQQEVNERKAPAAIQLKEFTAKLPGGGTVELISVTEHLKKDKAIWWKPDGTPLENPPYTDPGGGMGIGPNSMGRVVAFRFDGLAEETLKDVSIGMIGSGGSRSLVTPKDKNGNPLPNLRGKIVSLPIDTASLTFEVSVPTGEWQRLSETNGDGANGAGLNIDGQQIGVSFMPAKREGENISISFAHNLKGGEVRIIAVEADENGTIHTPSRQRSVGAAGFTQGSAEFKGLAGKPLIGFRLEYRKRGYVTFENVAIAPGAKQEVRVIEPVEGWGSFSGQFLYDGDWPEPKLLMKKGEGALGWEAPQDIYSRELIVDKKSMGLKNVFVYLTKKPDKIHPDLVEPNQPGLSFHCLDRRFEPHALIVRTDQTVGVQNSDPLYTNVHGYPIYNEPFNRMLEIRDRKGFQVDFRRAERIPFRIVSDQATWMKAHWLVVDHPYAALTDEQGKFTIKNLPAGTHYFKVWHEKFGFLNRKMTIEIKPGKRVKLAPQKISGEASEHDSNNP